MFNRPQVRDILATGEIGTSTEVMGWVVTKRTQKTFSFIELNDGSVLNGLQIIVDNTVPNYDESIALAGTGASIRFVGRIVASQGAKQRIEVHADELEIIGTVPESYPLQKKRQGPGVLALQCAYPCTHQSNGNVDSCPRCMCASGAQVLPRPQFPLCSYAHHHSQ